MMDSVGRPGEIVMPTVPMTFRQIADDLAARIRAGEYAPESQLPSYSELAALYSVSVTTASKAVALLRDRGLVEGIAGRGVYVAPPTSE